VPHERRTNPFAVMVMRNVQVVDEGAPFGIFASVGTYEADNLGLYRRDADELAIRGPTQTLAPYCASVAHQVTVQERVWEAPSVRAPPAIGVKLCNTLSIGRFCNPVLHDFSVQRIDTRLRRPVAA
jgi:hypothetical protein